METQEKIITGIADIKVAKNPSVIMTNLGSCIAVCLYDQKKMAGGMLHLMMAEAGSAREKEGFKVAKYADTGIPMLLNEMKKNFGSTPADLVAKIFGGAKILQKVSKDIGRENEEKVRQILKECGIPLRAQKTGGEKGYKVSFNLATGKVLCQIFGEQEEEF